MRNMREVKHTTAAGRPTGNNYKQVKNIIKCLMSEISQATRHDDSKLINVVTIINEKNLTVYNNL